MSARDTTQQAPPTLPAELWLQILEYHATDSLPHLWTEIRPISRTCKTHVERIFTHAYLPSLSLSLGLPRRDPKSSALKYAFILPDAEVVFHFSSVDSESGILTLSSPAATMDGDAMGKLRQEGKLTKERLDGTAGVWMWFGRNRGKGGSIRMPVDSKWDYEVEAWKIQVPWKTLVGSFFGAKVGKAKKKVWTSKQGSASGAGDGRRR